MKVFEVTIEDLDEDKKSVITEHQYVTSDDDSLESVVTYFTRHCFEYERDLKGVREVVTIAQHIAQNKE